MPFAKLCTLIFGKAFTLASDTDKKKMMASVERELREHFGLAQSSVNVWKIRGIPSKRVFEVVRFYQLDPACLI